MTLTEPVAFTNVPLESAMRPVTLAARDWLSAGYVRLRFIGAALAGFNAPGADDHVRIFFVEPGATAPDGDGWRELDSREYTPVASGPDWVDFEFVIHGDGPGSTWAATAPLGSEAAIGGPRRSHAIAGEPDAWFLAGDETAIPAISRFLRSRRPGSPARVILEVAAENEALPVPVDADTDLTLLRRGEQSLASVLAGLGPNDRPAGQVLAFVAAEGEVVQAAQPLLGERWSLPAEAVITKAYWRKR